MVNIPEGFASADFNKADLIDPGYYVASILSSKSKVPASGGEPYIALTVGIQVAEDDTRWLWENLNINHPKAFVANMAGATLQSILHATGKLDARDTDELIGIQMNVEVGVKKRKGGEVEENYIKRYVPRGEKVATGRRAATPF